MTPCVLRLVSWLLRMFQRPVNALNLYGGIMEIEEETKEPSVRTFRAKLELPFDLRAFGWAVWHILLGFCLGVAVHNLAVVMRVVR